MRAPKGALSLLRTHPGSWVGRAVRHNTTPLGVFRSAEHHFGDSSWLCAVELARGGVATAVVVVC
jgi:hypothetical protein